MQYTHLSLYPHHTGFLPFERLLSVGLVFVKHDKQLKWKKEFMQTEFPDEFSPERWDFDVDLLFVEPLKCPECNKSLKIMRSSECPDGGCDVIGHCIFCLQDWEWHCDKQGWQSDMRRFFHG